jgi:hypothetical protein
MLARDKRMDALNELILGESRLYFSVPGAILTQSFRHQVYQGDFLSFAG